MSTPGTGFLKFNSHPPKIYITADDEEFDPLILQNFKNEGFHPTYLPWREGGKPYRTDLAHLSENLELGESYAIIAFASAATDCLSFHTKPQPKLCALVTYYPTHIPNPNTRFPAHLDVLCHLAGSQPFAPAFPAFTYRNVRPGFAEYDLEEYDRVAASLAWTRTLGAVRKAFGLGHGVDLEGVKERHTGRVFGGGDAGAVVEGFTGDGYVNHVPTMAGGFGQKELFLFYRDEFIAKSPPSLNMKLVSRTAGVDRVVDEFVLSFKHTQEVPWLLPNVQPTGKVVHVGMVSIVCVLGGKLCSEHVYWDQASVLVQVGLLDPGVVPESFRKQGLKRLPVLGAEAAAKVLDEESHPSNVLIPGWKKRLSSRTASLPARPKQAASTGQNQGSAS